MNDAPSRSAPTTPAPSGPLQEAEALKRWELRLNAGLDDELYEAYDALPDDEDPDCPAFLWLACVNDHVAGMGRTPQQAIQAAHRAELGRLSDFEELFGAYGDRIDADVVGDYRAFAAGLRLLCLSAPSEAGLRECALALNGGPPERAELEAVLS